MNQSRNNVHANTGTINVIYYDSFTNQILQRYNNLAYGSQDFFPTIPTKTGFTFKGFYTERIGGILLAQPAPTGDYYILNYDNGVVFGQDRGPRLYSPASGNTHYIYAQWTGSASTVTFNANGGTGGPSARSIQGGTHMQSISQWGLPTRSGGYVLTGYFTQATGGTQVFDGTGWMASNVSGLTSQSNQYWIGSGNITLYAQWRLHEASFTASSTRMDLASLTNATIDSKKPRYTWNNGSYMVSGGYASSSPKITSGTTTRLPVPTIPGYTFIGWAYVSYNLGENQYYYYPITDGNGAPILQDGYCTTAGTWNFHYGTGGGLINSIWRHDGYHVDFGCNYTSSTQINSDILLSFNRNSVAHGTIITFTIDSEPTHGVYIIPNSHKWGETITVYEDGKVYSVVEEALRLGGAKINTSPGQRVFTVKVTSCIQVIVF